MVSHPIESILGSCEKSTIDCLPVSGPYIYYLGAEPLTIHMVRVRKHTRLPLVTYLRGGERVR